MTARKRSTFLGPQRAIQTRYPNWVIHMQFFDIEPGEFWTPAYEADLLTPRILTPHPTASRALFQYYSPQFVWIFRIGLIWNWIQIRTNRPERIFAFTHIIHFGAQSFAYNDQTDPAGVYGINGSATISWKRAP